MESCIDQKIGKREACDKMNEKINQVAFISQETKNAFLDLSKGKFEEKQLYEFIERAIGDLKENPMCGIWIPKKLIPKEYVLKLGINNLRKYNLPNAWRLLYSTAGDEIKIVSVIIEWLDHKSYEKRFRY